MAWLRIGDNASTHPKMSLLLEMSGFDHRLKNEAFGLMVSLATVSAAHLSDYLVEPGLIAQFAPGREKELINILVNTALIERIQVDGRWQYKLHNDEEFIHMRLKDEVEIDRARKRDQRRPELIIPVRVRDGDQCRWCEKTVSWTDRKSARAATIDSLTGHRDSSVDTLVVACNGCNSAGHEGKERHLKPAPSKGSVYYSPQTIAYVNNSDYAKEHGIHLKDRQTRLDIPAAPEATADQAAAPGAAHREEASQAAAHDAAPATAHPHAAAQAAAPDRYRNQAAAGQDPWEDAPDWVTKPASEVLSITQQDRASQAAAHDAAPATAPPDVDKPPEDNETIKPKPDLGQVGDGPGLSGSGRVGNGRVGNGSVSRPRRRRGRRGGRKKA